MKNLLFAFIVLLPALSALSNDPKPQKRVPMKQFLSKQGGLVKDTRKMTGRLVIINAQSEVDARAVSESTVKFEHDAKIIIEHSRGNFSLKEAKRIGEATVFVISDETLPVTMIAIDDGWGFVNVAKLRTNKTEYLSSRVQKEIIRVSGFLLGAGDSALYPMCLTGNVRDVAYLDQIPSVQLPNDVMQRVEKAMPGIGIMPYRSVTYRMACHEGWAPPPTNEFQKAIWDKVHAIPSKPLKIEFDPKTDTK